MQQHTILVECWARHWDVQVLLRVHLTKHETLVMQAVMIMSHGEHISRSTSMHAIQWRRVIGNVRFLVTNMR